MAPSDEDDARELLERAADAFPWFEPARLPGLVEAIRETAFQASRVASASRPAELLSLDCEHAMALAILDVVAGQIRAAVCD